MHQRGGIQSVAAVFAAHLQAGDTAQIGIDEIDQRLARCLVSGTEAVEQARE
jgi:hypothetical protein